MMRLPTVLVALALAAPLAHAADQKKVQKLLEAQQLLEHLASGQTGVNQAVNRLSFLDATTYASSALGDALKSTVEPARRGRMLEALALLAVPHPETENQLIVALLDDDVGHVRAACQALARIKSKKAVPRLRELLSARLIGSRRAAALALGAIGDPKAGGDLLKAAKLEEDPEVRALMLVSVGKAGDAKQAGGLEPFLEHSSESARNAAAQALCLLGSPRGVAHAKKLLASDDRFQRQQAVGLFDGAKLKVASPVLTPALADLDHVVRARAARILYQAGDTARLEWLVVESYKTPADQRLPYEDELERLRVSDEQRKAALTRAGLE